MGVRECGPMQNGGSGPYVVCWKGIPLGYMYDPYGVPWTPRGFARGVQFLVIFLCSKNQIPPAASVFTEGGPLLGGHGRPPGTPPTQSANSLVYPSSWATGPKNSIFGHIFTTHLHPLPKYQIHPKFACGWGHPRTLYRKYKLGLQIPYIGDISQLSGSILTISGLLIKIFDFDPFYILDPHNFGCPAKLGE